MAISRRPSKDFLNPLIEAVRWPVAPDEWVAYECAKLRRFYDTKMHLPDRTAIEFFDGPHTIHGEGTFRFLREHLKWPH